MADRTYIHSSKPMAAHEQDWALALGRFILAFGWLEWTTLFFLDQLITERTLVDMAVSLGFSKRVDLVIQLIEAKDLDRKLTAEAVSLLRQAKELAKTRNVIAHNPAFADESLSDMLDSLAEGGPRASEDLQWRVRRYGTPSVDAGLTLESLQDKCRDVERIYDRLGHILVRFDEELGTFAGDDGDDDET